MKVTLFTGNQERHNYFINLLSDTVTELNVIQENRTLFPGVVSGGYPQSDLMRDYFLKEYFQFFFYYWYCLQWFIFMLPGVLTPLLNWK